jgi:hypothetical protein
METSGQTGSRRSFLTFCVLAALLGLAAAGCGGESEAQKQADVYANGLCTGILGWRSNIETIASTLQAGPPRAAARAKLVRAEIATRHLVRTIRTLPIPSTSGAEEAKQDVDSFVAQAVTTAGSIGIGIRQIRSYGTGPANVGTVVVPIALELTELVQTGQSTVTSLKAVKGSFDSAVKKSEACTELTGTGQNR